MVRSISSNPIINIIVFLHSCSWFLVAVAGYVSLACYLSSFTKYIHSEVSLCDPLLLTGILLFVLPLLALVVARCCGRGDLFGITFWISILLWFIGLAVFTGFFFVVSDSGEGDKALSGTGFRKYHLENYSSFFQKHFVNDEKTWSMTRSCLIDNQVCSGLGRNFNQSAADFHTITLSPLQWGCCVPPTECGFESKNSDCFAWRNKEDTLCYNCNSCKAGMLAIIKRNWRIMAIVDLCVIIYFFITFILFIVLVVGKNYSLEFS